MTVTILPPTPDTLRQAASLLASGKLVAFPTETVYGLGADARDDRAVASIYAAKGRPQFNPLIIHVASIEAAKRLVDVPPLAEKAMERFWPGPLTLVLPRLPDCGISLLASAGLDTLAIRFPSHPVAHALLKEAAIPVAAPSANASGKLSPTTAEHVAESLGENVHLIVDGGATKVGVESTVLDLTTEIPTILRHGGVTREMLEEVFGEVRTCTEDPTAPKSPGMLLSHYAPALPVRLNATQARADEAFLTFGPEDALMGGKLRLNLSPSGNLEEAAAHLFAFMRQLDQPGLSGIAVAPIPPHGMGAAILDRLSRAAAPRG